MSRDESGALKPGPDSPQVVAEVAAGKGKSLAQAARSLPGARGKPCSPSTLWRWACHGVKLPTGGRVYLELARLGCRWFTTEAAILRFLGAQNGQAVVGMG